MCLCLESVWEMPTLGQIHTGKFRPVELLFERLVRGESKRYRTVWKKILVIFKIFKCSPARIYEVCFRITAKCFLKLSRKAGKGCGRRIHKKETEWAKTIRTDLPGVGEETRRIITLRCWSVFLSFLFFFFFPSF